MRFYDASMHWIHRLLTSLCLALLLGGGALAQMEPLSAPAPTVTIEALRAELDRLPRTAESSDEVRGLISRINAFGDQTQKFIAARTDQLADLNARLGELGNAPAAGAGPDDPDITRRRATLLKERNAVDADVRLARLLLVDAQQRGAELLKRNRASFEARLTERAPSPVGREFWRDLGDAWPEDSKRLDALGEELRQSSDTAWAPDNATAVTVALVLALLVVVLGNWAAEAVLVKLAARWLPGGRLRRSLLIIATVGVNVLLVGGAAVGVFSTLDARGVWGEQSRKLAEALTGFAFDMAFVIGLGRALLSNKRPSWRLPPISDVVAQRLAPFPWLTALVALGVWTPAKINEIIGGSLAAVVATHTLTALALTLLIGAMLWRLRPPAALAVVPPPAEVPPQDGPAQDDTTKEPRPLWAGLLLGGVALSVAAVWVLMGLGYVALASFVADQLVWTGIVACTFYVLFKFADDLFMALVSSRSHMGLRLQKSLGFQPQTLDQAAVLLSGVARLALFFYMAIALITPFGSSPEEVFQRSGQYGTGLKIGEFELVPGAILGFLGVLVAGFVVLRVLKHWLEEHYLPSTTLETGMRSSITTLLGYAGGILVIALALSALGIGLNRIGWIASALSVGIGFGLQAIVQNFISGLILLAERPVKVGDWVVLGTTEGDVKRINVRATEIQLGDRSTLIVPNSEFITKTVRNMTLANAEGRVLIRLPMPLTTDAQQVRSLMLSACNMHPTVLPTPAPSLTLEGIENGLLIFQAIAYVPSPRLAGGVRSELLFTILEELKQAGLPLAAPTVVMTTPAPPAA